VRARGAVTDGPLDLNPSRTPELLADMERAAGEFIAWLEQNPDRWDRAPAGKWTAGQHAAHLILTYSMTAERFEQSATEFEAGRMPEAPRRGLLQRLGVHLLTQSRKFPRGGKTIPQAVPGPHPDRVQTLAQLRQEIARQRRLVERLGPEGLARVWIRNPFIKLNWHYLLPEMLRVHAQHTRHHAMLSLEAANVSR
jgi:hypothetical protein